MAENETQNDPAQEYKDAAEADAKLADDSREEVQEKYEERRKADEAKEQALRDPPPRSLTFDQNDEDSADVSADEEENSDAATDAVGQPTSGPAVAESAAGPVEEVAAERTSEAKAKKPAAKKKSE